MLRFSLLLGCLFWAVCLPGDAKSVELPVGAPGATHRTGQQAPPVPGSLTVFVRQATLAVNRHDITRMQPFAAGNPAQTLAWVEDVATKTWQGDALRLPTASNSVSDNEASVYLAVFHAWHGCESDGDHVHRLTHTSDGQGWQLGDEIPETDTGGFRVRDHDLHISLTPGRHFATITDTIQVERTSDKPLQTSTPLVLLRLSQDFAVHTITRDDKAVEFVQAGGIVILPAPDVPKFALALRYDGIVNHQGSAYIHENEAVLAAYFYPHTARLPATSTVTVTAPPGWTPIAQGEKQSETKAADGSLTATYRNAIPCCYFTVDAGKYVVTSRKLGGVSASVWLLSPNVTLAQRSLDALERVMRYYTTTLGPFPYTRYALVETRGPFPGALEAYSFATYGADTLPDTVAHELAHTWWGGLVPCTYLRSMWNESLAMYTDDLYRRVTRGEADNAEAIKAARPVLRPRFGTDADGFALGGAHDTSDERQALVGYGKGQFVLRTLEAQIGRDKMIAAMQGFVKQHPKGEAAEWPEFFQAVNAATGDNYDWFRAQWVDRPGLPLLHVSPWKVSQGGAGFVIEADVAQAGMPYRLRLPVRITMRDGRVQTLIAQVDGATTHLRLETAAPPVRLVLDPDGAIPFALPRDGKGSDPLTFDLTQ